MKAYPEDYPEKCLEASVFSFALGCGARAVSCANVHFSDVKIIELEEKEEESVYSQLFK